MTGNETNGTSSSLPAVLTSAAPQANYHRAVPKAAFLSQLIAERHHLPPQRARRRAPIAQAVDAYRIGGGIATIRMPAGYRKTVVA
ncbi:MAG: hypothetical protein ACYC0C_09885 [Devosia sp.]